MKTLRFCLGDYRSGSKEYRIFRVRTLTDVRKITNHLGLPEITAENCPRYASDSDPEFALVKSALLTLEMFLRWVENVVCCTREEYDEAQRMKRHFLDSDVSLYFPKLVDAGDGKNVVLREDQPWIVEYWKRRITEGRGMGPMPFVMS